MAWRQFWKKEDRSTQHSWPQSSLVRATAYPPVRRQTITWTNTDLLPVILQRTNSYEILYEIPKCSLEHWKFPSAKMAAMLCSGLDVLIRSKLGLTQIANAHQRNGHDNGNRERIALRIRYICLITMALTGNLPRGSHRGSTNIYWWW